MANKNAIPPEHGKFKTGQSGNPNGRPKGVPNTSTRLQRFLNATRRGKNPVSGEEEEFTVAELMDLQQIAKAIKGDTAAWEKILDRLEGKARTPVDMNVNQTATADELTAEQMAAFDQIINGGNGNSDSGAKNKVSAGKLGR